MIELKKLYLATDFDQRRVFYAGVDARRAWAVASKKRATIAQWLCAIDGNNIVPVCLAVNGLHDPTFDISGAEIDLTEKLIDGAALKR